MVSTFTTAHSRAEKSRKTTKVGMSNLVPHDRSVISHLNKIDQSLFVIFCLNPASGRNKMKADRVFSLYDVQKLRAVSNPAVQRLIRLLGAVAIERGYLVYKRYLRMHKHRLGVTLADAFNIPSSSRVRGIIYRLQLRAQRLLAKLSDILPGFHRLRRRYCLERVLDGIVGTMPPWAAQAI